LLSANLRLYLPKAPFPSSFPPKHLSAFPSSPRAYILYNLVLKYPYDSFG